MAENSRARLWRHGVAAVLGVALIAVTSPAVAAGPRDDGRLAFVRHNQIYTATTTGTQVKKLTRSAKNYRPHWSPDGRRIAYLRETAAGVRNIWVMNADGTGKTQVTHQSWTSEPAWSPDGRWLAFGGDAPNDYTNDGHLQRIRSTAPFGSPIAFPPLDQDTIEPIVDGSGTLAWSPTGEHIAFASDSYPDSPDHYLLLYTIPDATVTLLDAVGGSCCGEGYFADPTWTVDGGAIAYTRLKYDFESEPRPAGSHVALLNLVPGATARAYPRVPGDRNPDYSPTGRRLVFNHYSWIYTSDADGKRRRHVIKGYHPDWQPVIG